MMNLSPIEWLMVDVANNFNKDKLLYDQRIDFVTSHGVRELSKMANELEGKSKPLAIKSVMSLRDALMGKPVGHMVDLDQTCSGIQELSVLSSCRTSGLHVNLVDNTKRYDAYTDGIGFMNEFLPENMHLTLAASATSKFCRASFKDAFMTSYYDSIAQPMKLFGKGSNQLRAFWKAREKMTPGCVEVQKIINSIFDEARGEYTNYNYVLPNGFHVYNNIVVEESRRVIVPSIDNEGNPVGFNHNFKAIGTNAGDRSPVANITHSMDGLTVGDMSARCTYDRRQWEDAWNLLDSRLVGTKPIDKEIYHSSQNICHINENSIYLYSENSMRYYKEIIEHSLEHKPFPYLSTHDAHRCHANNVNHMMKHFNDIMANKCESQLLNDICRQLTGDSESELGMKEVDTEFVKLIRNAKYAIT